MNTELHGKCLHIYNEKCCIKPGNNVIMWHKVHKTIKVRPSTGCIIKYLILRFSTRVIKIFIELRRKN